MKPEKARFRKPRTQITVPRTITTKHRTGASVQNRKFRKSELSAGAQCEATIKGGDNSTIKRQIIPSRRRLLRAVAFVALKGPENTWRTCLICWPPPQSQVALIITVETFVIKFSILTSIFLARSQLRRRRTGLLARRCFLILLFVFCQGLSDVHSPSFARLSTDIERLPLLTSFF